MSLRIGGFFWILVGRQSRRQVVAADIAGRAEPRFPETLRLFASSLLEVRYSLLKGRGGKNGGTRFGLSLTSLSAPSGGVG